MKDSSFSTSLFLKGITADVEHMDVSSATSVQSDYIVTSKELAQNLTDSPGKIIVVNNYFDLGEIKAALEGLKN